MGMIYVNCLVLAITTDVCQMLTVRQNFKHFAHVNFFDSHNNVVS